MAIAKAPSNRMTPGSITLFQLYSLSTKLYQGKVDNKARRARLDITSIKAVQRNNFKYNQSTKQWEPVTPAETKIVFIISSHPKSYKSDGKTHKYPVTFIFKDVSLGIHSPFRWRTGGLKNPIFPNAKMTEAKKAAVAAANIKNGTQLQFFFEIEFVSKMFGTLYGRCRAKWPPRKTNPKNYLFFDKHAYACTRQVLLPLLRSGKGLQLNRPVKV